MKKNFDLLGIPAFNISLLSITEWIKESGITIEQTQQLFQIFLLICTIVFTIVRTYFVIKNKGEKDAKDNSNHKRR